MSGTLNLENALHGLLDLIYINYPSRRTMIWCDPDPAGLVIADNARRLVEKYGNVPEFYMMDAGVLGVLEQIVLASHKLKPLSDADFSLLTGRELSVELIPLANEFLSHKMKGEQESIVVSPSFQNLLNDLITGG